MFTYWYIYDKNINWDNDYKITDVSSKEFNENDAAYWRCTNITNPNDPAKLPTFAEQLKNLTRASKDDFLTYIKDMKIIEKIEYTGVEQNASAAAILVKDDIINTKKIRNTQSMNNRRKRL